MILYIVYNGIITAQSVKKETSTGWRENNNGFINRRVMGSVFVPSLDTSFYTTNWEEAVKWQERSISHMKDAIEVAKTSRNDIEFWRENLDCDENNPPESRVFYRPIKDV